MHHHALNQWSASMVPSCSLHNNAVAIIGAGPGGSAAAYYLSQLGDAVPITIYERSDYVGGRSTTVDVLGQVIELGASIFVEVNTNLKTAAEVFNLTIIDPEIGLDPAERTLGIWDGTTFVYKDMGGSTYWNLAKLVWRYGLAPYRAQRYVSAVLASFLRLYEALPFASLTETAAESGLLAYTNTTGFESFRTAGVSAPFVRDVVNAATRVNYAQDIHDMHGLMSAVSFITDDARAIEGGNRRIFEAMVDASRAELRLNTSVTSISRNGHDDSWCVCDDGAAHCSSFASVILAAPLSLSDITVSPAVEVSEVEYVTLHVTLIATERRPSREYFATDSVPASILTTTTTTTTTTPAGDDLVGGRKSDDDVFTFQSLSVVGKVNATTLVYKLFSRTRPGDGDLDGLFDGPVTGGHAAGRGGNSFVLRKSWQAYPVARPTAEFDDWEVARGFWYLNTMERFVSTMETATLAGKNVAALVADRMGRSGR